MNASVKWKEGLSFIGSASSGFHIDLGADTSVGGANDGFRPLELMAISLAGCTAMDVISILQKKKQNVTSFEVSVHAEQSPEHPRVFTQIKIEYHLQGNGLDESALLRAIELSSIRYCPAQAMLGKVVPMQIVYQLEDLDTRTIKEGTYTPAYS